MWRHHSTNSVREVMEEFARTAFEEPRQVNMKTLKTETIGYSVVGNFRLKGGTQVYRFEGNPPGVWEVEAVLMK